MNQYRNALLIIDAQYDFCHPNGALYVPGADQDMRRLAKFIAVNSYQINHIVVTLDTHPVNDISHPSFWADAKGVAPAPFTQITLADVKAGTWKARHFPNEAENYLADLEAQGEFPHLIWPEHCLQGSRGAALDDHVMEALKVWARRGKNYQAVTKGTHPLTEHFGIFQAQVPIPNAPETQLNRELLDTLHRYEQIYLVGEARSHCVATSLKQAMDYAPELAAKMVIVEDCMSDVTGLGHLGQPIYEVARKKGLRFVSSTAVML